MDFFEKECELLKAFCSGYEMYETLLATKTESTVEVDCWYNNNKVETRIDELTGEHFVFNNGTVKKFLVDVEKGTVTFLNKHKETESSFLLRLVS